MIVLLKIWNTKARMQEKNNQIMSISTGKSGHEFFQEMWYFGFSFSTFTYGSTEFIAQLPIPLWLSH